jgi:hypothetical protein
MMRVRQATARQIRQPKPDPAAGDRGCRWLEGDATARQFCAAPVSSIGSSWCADHIRRVFNQAALQRLTGGKD